MESPKKTLSKKALKEIDSSNTVKGMLADAFDKSHQTVQRWVAENNIMLTNVVALNIYEKELGLKQSEILI